jgi:hypothetical protein
LYPSELCIYVLTWFILKYHVLQINGSRTIVNLGYALRDWWLYLYFQKEYSKMILSSWRTPENTLTKVVIYL